MAAPKLDPPSHAEPPRGTPMSDNLPVPRARAKPPAVPPPPKQLVAMGNAIVATAKVGRIFGRVGLRMARNLPGGATFEREVTRIGNAIVDALTPEETGPHAVYANVDEERVMLLLTNTTPDDDPLRTAMGELLERSIDTTSRGNREYLFGSIISQLIPDEARIVSTLATSGSFPVIDLIAKPVGRGEARVVLANVSPVGRAAGCSMIDDTPTYLSRLHNFNLIEYGPANDKFADNYDVLAHEPMVMRARAAAEGAKHGGTVRLRRRTVTLSPLGREFWSATSPDRAALN